MNVADRALIAELITVVPDKNGRIEFHAGASSRSRVLVDHEAAPGAKERAVECDFYLEPGACVDVFHVLEGESAPESLSVKVRYHLKKHAALNSWIYVGGGDFSVFEQEVLFKEEHAFASLRGLTIAGGRTHVHHKVKADHAAGHCISRQFFKSLAGGQAKTAFESLVSVAPGAEKSDSKQLNKNLLLSNEAQASSRPELRIHTDDVSCAHGSATGQMNKDELFYLQSRGIAKDQARVLMMEGFAEEAMEEVSSPELKEHLDGLVRERVLELSR